MTEYELIVIGGGPAGLAAAIESRKRGIDRILVIERDRELGGILQQCIHNGFGLKIFKSEMTGPEYAERFISELSEMNIDYKLNSMVTEIGRDRSVLVRNPEDGLVRYHPAAVILAMGCRERPRGAIMLPGTRPSGIFTAGTAQRYLNMEGHMVGKQVVILGSGDIGLIMARRMTLEGANVMAVVEVMPYSSGLARNKVQCLDDFGIPLLLGHTVREIRGTDRVRSVIISQVDEHRNYIEGTDTEYICDTLLLSVGLIPENELTRQAGIEIDPATNGPVVNEAMETSAPGIFACGNVVHVHDLVDFVTEESRRAGASAARFITNRGRDTGENCIRTRAGTGVSYIVTQKIREDNLKEKVTLFLRVRKPYRNAVLSIRGDGKEITTLKKKIMTPGEMQHITLDSTLIKDKQIREITMDVTGEVA